MISPLSAGAQSSGSVANQQSRGFSPMLPSAAPESTPSSMGPLQPAIPQHGNAPTTLKCCTGICTCAFPDAIFRITSPASNAQFFAGGIEITEALQLQMEVQK